MLLTIDFGTSNSCASLVVDGKVRLIKEPVKQTYSFPSSLYLDESEQFIIGHLAESKKFKNITRYRNQIKKDLIKTQPYLLGKNAQYQFTAQELITEIIKNLKDEGEKVTKALGQQLIRDVIITIPATYRQNKRMVMEQIALNAGFTSVELIEEPVAAATYYHSLHTDTFHVGDIILIYDLGGGTFDATVIKKLGKGFQILGQPVGLANCGGTNFDRAIFQNLISNCSDELREKLSVRGNTPEKNSLLDFCRQIKHQFSGSTEAFGHIPLNYEPYELSRDEFNNAIASDIERTIICCEDLIKSQNLELSDISKVLMVGGSCRLPYIKETVGSRLESSVLLMDDPELAVCRGAIMKDLVTLKNEPDDEILHGNLTPEMPQSCSKLDCNDVFTWF